MATQITFDFGESVTFNGTKITLDFGESVTFGGTNISLLFGETTHAHLFAAPVTVATLTGSLDNLDGALIVTSSVLSAYLLFQSELPPGLAFAQATGAGNLTTAIQLQGSAAATPVLEGALAGFVGYGGLPSFARLTSTGFLAFYSPSLPLLTVSGAGGAAGSLTAPTLVLSGELLNKFDFGIFELPKLVSTGELLTGEAFEGTPSLPVVTATGQGGIQDDDTQLPKLTSAGVLLTGDAYSGSFSLPAPFRVTTSFGYQRGDYYGTPSLPKVAATGVLLNAAPLSGTPSLPKVTAVGALLNGAVFSGNPTFPVLRALGELISERLYTGTPSLPPMRGAGTLQGTIGAEAVSGATAWALNIENGGMTNYENFAFHTLGAFNGKYIGVGPSGVYELTGSDDQGVDIVAELETGDADFGSENLKRVPEIYAGYSADGDVELGYRVDGGRTKIEKARRVSYEEGVKTGRVSPGQGLESRYWRLRLRNVKGADFFLETAGMLVRVLKRKT